jgi:hypothetical protein
MRSLAAALSANSARLATLEESQVAPLSSSMALNSSRVAALEAALDELRAHLAQQQQQDRREFAGAAAEGSDAPEERLAALESSLAELQLSMAHMHGAAAAPSECGSELRTSASARAVATAAAAASAAAGKQGGFAVLEVQAELGELRARVADLSACLAGAGGGAVEETFLPFMETTSNCLQQHEQQLDTIQVGQAGMSTAPASATAAPPAGPDMQPDLIVPGLGLQMNMAVPIAHKQSSVMHLF